MKKVLVVTNKLITGGVEISLLELVKVMIKNGYDVTLGVCKLGGNLEKEFPQNIKIVELPEVNLKIKDLIIGYLKSGKIFKVFQILKNVFICNLIKDYNKQCYYKSKLYTNFEGEYDIAICYHKPTDLPVAYTINNINAKMKILWLHSEVKSISENEKEGYYDIYNKYDQIICASKTIKQQLINIFPMFSKRIKVIYNIINKEKILDKANIGEKFVKIKNKKIILTVARLSPEKGCTLLLDAAKQLKEENVDFIWYIIGNGPMEDEIKMQIKKYKLEENIKLMGRKENPYGYFKTCDIYVQPSFEEGYGITVAEAKIFCKPIVITNFGTAKEHIINGENGYIVDFNGKELSNAILKIINDSKIENLFKENLESLAQR